MVAYRQTTETRSRIGQTPNYSECLVRTHPSLTGQAWPSFVSSAIRIGSVFWHLSSSAQLHSSVETRLFRLQEHLHEHLLVDSTLLDPHMHRMSWRTCLVSIYLLVAITVACHLALPSKRERFRDDMVNEQVGVCALLDQVSVVWRDATLESLFGICGVV